MAIHGNSPLKVTANLKITQSKKVDWSKLFKEIVNELRGDGKFDKFISKASDIIKIITKVSQEKIEINPHTNDGSHRVTTLGTDLINLQKNGTEVKLYQVRQIADIIIEKCKTNEQLYKDVIGYLEIDVSKLIQKNNTIDLFPPFEHVKEDEEVLRYPKIDLKKLSEPEFDLKYYLLQFPTNIISGILKDLLKSIKNQSHGNLPCCLKIFSEIKSLYPTEFLQLETPIQESLYVCLEKNQKFLYEKEIFNHLKLLLDGQDKLLQHPFYLQIVEMKDQVILYPISQHKIAVIADLTMLPLTKNIIKNKSLNVIEFTENGSVKNALNPLVFFIKDKIILFRVWEGQLLPLTLIQIDNNGNKIDDFNSIGKITEFIQKLKSSGIINIEDSELKQALEPNNSSAQTSNIIFYSASEPIEEIKSAEEDTNQKKGQVNSTAQIILPPFYPSKSKSVTVITNLQYTEEELNNLSYQWDPKLIFQPRLSQLSDLQTKLSDFFLLCNINDVKIEPNKNTYYIQYNFPQLTEFLGDGHPMLQYIKDKMKGKTFKFIHQPISTYFNCEYHLSEVGLMLRFGNVTNGQYEGKIYIGYRSSTLEQIPKTVLRALKIKIDDFQKKFFEIEYKESQLESTNDQEILTYSRMTDAFTLIRENYQKGEIKGIHGPCSSRTIGDPEPFTYTQSKNKIGNTSYQVKDGSFLEGTNLAFNHPSISYIVKNTRWLGRTLIEAYYRNPDIEDFIEKHTTLKLPSKPMLERMFPIKILPQGPLAPLWGTNGKYIVRHPAITSVSNLMIIFAPLEIEIEASEEQGKKVNSSVKAITPDGTYQIGYIKEIGLPTLNNLATELTIENNEIKSANGRLLDKENFPFTLE